ncbi:MAG: LysM peptidoglycan-binding domain-containing protein [Leptospirillia bacterium]
MIVLGSAAFAGAARVGITDVRTWSGPDSTRLVIDLSGEPTYRVKRENDPPELVVEIKGGTPAMPRRDWGRVDSRIDGVHMETTDRGTRVVIKLPQKSPFKHFALTPYGTRKPHRIVVDVLPARGKKVTRREPPAPVKTARSSGGKPFVVVIDPGHGGEDPGAFGRYQHTAEKDVVLKIGRYLKQELDRYPGFSAHLTRNGDYFISLGGRIRKANRLNGDLFVSIHADSSKDRRTRGTHVYTLAPRSANDRRAVRVARMENASDFVGGVQAVSRLPMIFDRDGNPNNMVESRVLAGLAMDHFGNVNKNGRRARQSEARFWVLKGKRPSILVETGFLSSKKDEQALRSESFQRQLARDLAKAIHDYYETRVVSSTFVHVVRKGESLSRLSQRYGVPVSAITAANRIRNASRVKVGTRLVIPARGVKSTAGSQFASVQTPAPKATAPKPRVSRPAAPVSAVKPPQVVQASSSRHRVRRGENLTRIAHKYGVRLSDLMEINKLTPRSKLEVGKSLKVPNRRPADRLHVVRNGETLSGLASSYRVPIRKLARVNDISSRARLKRGQKLLVPDVGGPSASFVHVVGRGQTLSGLAQRFGVPLSRLAAANGLSTRAKLLKGQRLNVPGVASVPQVHVIRRGDSLIRIAKRYHVPVSRLRAKNGLQSSDRLLIGDRLVIPN